MSSISKIRTNGNGEHGKDSSRHREWVSMLGHFETVDGGLDFHGSDTPPSEQPPSPNSGRAPEERGPSVAFGLTVCDERFIEGEISVEVEFDVVDHRSVAEIVLQHDTRTLEMLNAGLNAPVGFFSVRRWVSKDSAETAGDHLPKKSWQNFTAGGDRGNLQPNRKYRLQAWRRGSSVTLTINGVDVAECRVPQPDAGQQMGLFCASHGKVRFRHFRVDPVRPRAFVVMQFNTKKYDDLYEQVISPVCKRMGLDAFRADETFSPGLVVADITKQIAESRVVIAEITPANPNVYYEVGYADALRKPLILIADRTGKDLPFDVRPYRTIFYEDSIGGKQRVEDTLSQYLVNIMEGAPAL